MLFRHATGAYKIKDCPETPMEFMTLRDCDELLYLSSESLNHGDFAFRYAIKAFDMAAYIGENEVGTDEPLHVELYVVSPQAAGGHNIRKAIESCGYESFPPPGKTRKERESRNIAVCEALLDCGISVPVYSLVGGHRRILEDGYWNEPENVCLDTELDEGVALMKRHAVAVNQLFGFFMDREVNQVGATGWDLIKGQVFPR